MVESLVRNKGNVITEHSIRGK